MMASKAAIRWCAVYTRKSSEDGLEQEFNSLHAQREAAAAYIKSQEQEGWRLLAAEYDDGGYSGGNLDLQAVILGCHLAYPLMKQGGEGVIVNTASMAGIYPMPLDPVYAAAKAGVVHLTYSLVNWQKEGVRVNCVCPGITNTPMVARMLDTRNKAELKSVKPQNLLQPDSIADVVLNFIHDDRLAGQVIEVRPSGPQVMPARQIVGRHGT